MAVGLPDNPTNQTMRLRRTPELKGEHVPPLQSGRPVYDAFATWVDTPTRVNVFRTLTDL